MAEQEWKDIASYPRCTCDGGWGPAVALRFPDGYAQVGWLEAGMWLYREPDEPNCCGEFEILPIGWKDIGYEMDLPRRSPSPSS